MSKNYYYLHVNRDDEGGIAYAPDYIDTLYAEDLKDLEEVTFIFAFRDGHLQDYLQNDMGWPIFSEKFKEVITPFLANLDTHWVSVQIEDDKGNKHKYNVLKFNKKPDILNMIETIFVDVDDIDELDEPLVVKAVLSKEKVKKLDVFIVPDSNFQIIFSEGVKSEIEKNSITGINFSKVPVV